MVFSSYTFVFGFLPSTLLIYYLTNRYLGSNAALIILILCSLFFYGWWNPHFVWLIAVSIFFNFVLSAAVAAPVYSQNRKRYVLIMAIAGNLSLLGYFKYANFFTSNLNVLLNVEIAIGTIALPLAISFFTFQQIAFLVDAYRYGTRETNFLNYCLFIVFFPQLIAGPIVHHKEMMPQFHRAISKNITAKNLSIGLTIFSIGLFKKLFFADNLGEVCDEIFNNVSANGATFLESWLAALAFAGQIYFDFSAYSDMAVGLARIFGIRLPINFFSPYKALSIIDFWRRWHITLSRFLRDYVYIPLGGNRHGPARRFTNILVTMFLGGLWHGASWTFVLWGGLHGLFLVINHLWRAWCAKAGVTIRSRYGKLLGQLLTFVCVTVAWVLFRSTSFGEAGEILSGMAGLNGIILPAGVQGWCGSICVLLGDFGISFGTPGAFTVNGAGLIILSLAVAFVCPNTYEIMQGYRPVLDFRQWSFEKANIPKLFRWQPSVRYALITSVILVLVLISMATPKEFLYFEF